jgi:hypothetical protein
MHEKCSQPLAIRDMQIKTALRSHLSSVRIKIIKKIKIAWCQWFMAVILDRWEAEIMKLSV